MSRKWLAFFLVGGLAGAVVLDLAAVAERYPHLRQALVAPPPAPIGTDSSSRRAK